MEDQVPFLGLFFFQSAQWKMLSCSVWHANSSSYLPHSKHSKPDGIDGWATL